MAEAKSEFRHIVRVANTDLNGNKPLYLSLQKIKGIGENFARVVCHLAKRDYMQKTGELSEAEAQALETIILNPQEAGFPKFYLNRIRDYETGEDQHLFMNDLDYAIDQDIKRQKKIKSNIGMRHHWGLPVRGQRTQSNFRPNKGKAQGGKKKSTTRK